MPAATVDRTTALAQTTNTVGHSDPGVVPNNEMTKTREAPLSRGDEVFVFHSSCQDTRGKSSTTSRLCSLHIMEIRLRFLLFFSTYT